MQERTTMRPLLTAILLLSLAAALPGQVLTKEYIRLGDRTIAIENYLSATESTAANVVPGGGVTLSCCVVAAADFNKDGVPDLVWQNPSTGAAQIWYMGGTGGATIQSYATVSTGNTWRI